MALELEQIQPWDGQSGTGAEVRGALNRNFEKLKDLSILAGMPIKDLFTSVDLLPRPGISGNNYLVGENLYVWSESVLDYVDIGSVKGQDGLDGIDGKDSKQVTTVAYDGTRPVLRLLTDGSGVSYPVPTFSKSDGSTTTIITEAATYTNAEALSSKVDKGGSDKTLKQVEDEIVQLAGESTIYGEILAKHYDILSTYNGLSSKTTLEKTYKLDSIGDYIEIELEIFDALNNKGLSVIGTDASTGNSNNLFGVASSLQWIVRQNDGVFKYFPNIGGKYLTMSKKRLEVTASGWQLSVDGIVVSSIDKTGFLLINNFGQAYGSVFAYMNIKSVNINSASDGKFTSDKLYLLSGSINVDSLIVVKTNEGTLGKAVADVDELKDKKADKLFDITNEIRTGKAVNSRTGDLFIPPIGADKSTYLDPVDVSELSKIYYTGNAFSQSGAVFVKSDLTFLSTAIEMMDMPVFDYEISIPENAKYIIAGSRNSDVAVGLKILISESLSKTQKKVDEFKEQLNNPQCFVTFDKASNKFTVFTRDKSSQSTYYGFDVKLQSSIDKNYHEVDYAHLWRLINGYIYDYSLGIMIKKEQILLGIENEFTYLVSGKGDHTGGVHGDERIDLDANSGVTFFINGIPLTAADLSASFDLLPCNNFHYLQKSTLHETGVAKINTKTTVLATGAGVVTISPTNEILIDGTATGVYAYDTATVYIPSQITISKTADNYWQIDTRVLEPISGHPIVGEHIKKTSIENQGYKTWNRIKFKTPQNITQLFTGISCIHKNTAKYVNNEDYAPVEMLGAEGSFLTSIENRLYEGNNPSTKLSSKAKSWLLKSTNGYQDKDCEMHVWDRSSDSKYYRKVANTTVNISDIIECEMIVEFNKKN